MVRIIFYLILLCLLSISSSSSLRSLISCWGNINGTWTTDKKSFFTPFSDPFNIWKFSPFKCPLDRLQFQWNPQQKCRKNFINFNVKGFCNVMKGRPLVLMGDSLMYYTFLSFVNAMANGKPYSLDENGDFDAFTRLHPIEFAKYPPRTEFLLFDKACKDVDEEPFLVFMNNNAYLDVSPTTLEWIGNHSNSILFINRGFHFQRTTNDYEKHFKFILTNYLQRIHHQYSPSHSSSHTSHSIFSSSFHSSSTHSSLSKSNGYIIFRSIHMPHPSCSNYISSYPFTKENYSLYETPNIIQQLHQSYNWYDIIEQDKLFIQPIINNFITNNIYNASQKLFYVDILSSTKLMARRHTNDCLHYCVPGPMNSWIIFLYNILIQLNKRDQHDYD